MDGGRRRRRDCYPPFVNYRLIELSVVSAVCVDAQSTITRFVRVDRLKTYSVRTRTKYSGAITAARTDGTTFGRFKGTLNKLWRVFLVFRPADQWTYFNTNASHESRLNSSRIRCRLKKSPFKFRNYRKKDAKITRPRSAAELTTNVNDRNVSTPIGIGSDIIRRIYDKKYHWCVI